MRCVFLFSSFVLTCKAFRTYAVSIVTTAAILQQPQQPELCLTPVYDEHVASAFF